MRRFLLLAWVVLIWSIPLHSFAQATDWIIADYEQSMRELLAAAQRNDEIGVREASERIYTMQTLKTPNGDVLSVDHTWLQEALDTNTPNLNLIEERAGTIIEILNNTQLQDPESLETLRSILTAAPYNFEQQREPISRNPGPSLAFIGDCFTVLGFLFIGALIIYIIMAVRGSIQSKQKTQTAAITKDHQLAPIKLPTTSAKAIEQADQEAVSGDFREAVRYLYLSTLLWLAERNAIIFDRTLTNREVLAAIPHQSSLRNRLEPVVQTFDRVWYGFKDIDQQDFEHYRTQVTHLRGGQ